MISRYIANIFYTFLPPTRLFALKRMFLRISGINVGNKVSLCGHVQIYGRGKLILGDYSWIGPHVHFYTNTEACIEIGPSCDIGPEVKFVTGSHEIGGGDRRAGKGTANPIMVGQGVWIGAGVLVLGGVTIGAGSVIAAGTVLISDVPPNTLVGGVPGKMIKSLSVLI
jgi:maltose O-acetyltransferase